jgi:hypothetical protein
MAKRGCGFRKKGGIYAEIDLGDGEGVPFWNAIIDPPLPVDPDSLGVSRRGMRAVQVETDGKSVLMLIDWVGREFYPNVADFVEEASRMGISRRMPVSMDFSEFPGEVLLCLVHDRAVIRNPEPFWEEGVGWCYTENPEHDDDEFRGMCASLWWRDVEDEGVSEPSQKFSRSRPSFSYPAYSPPESADEEREVGMFFRWPISRLAVIEDPEGGRHEKAVEALQGCALPWELVPE